MLKTRVTVPPGVKRLAEALEPPKPAIEAAADAADSVFRRQRKATFESEGSAGGEKWKALSPAYKRWKDRQFRGAVAETKRVARARGQSLRASRIRAIVGADNKILQLSGDMKRAFATEGEGHLVETFKGARGWVIRLGAHGPAYFRYHHEGGGKVSGRPPKRDPLQHTPEQSRALLAAARRGLAPFILRTLRAAAQARAGFRPGA